MNMFLALWMLAANAGDVSNERIPLTGAELERHWQLNCSGMLADFNNRVLPQTAAGESKIPADELRGLADVAQKCSFIYNQKDTGRTVDCPNYQRVYDVLQNLLLGNREMEAVNLMTEKCDP
jgi:hypothetical protein